MKSILTDVLRDGIIKQFAVIPSAEERDDPLASVIPSAEERDDPLASVIPSAEEREGSPRILR